jgi:hypothetical protein
MDDRDLLELQAATIFAPTDSGRILRTNAPDHAAGPRLYLAGCTSGNVVRLRHDVADRTAQAIERLAADEPPLCHPHSTPVHLDGYLQLLAAEAPVEQCEAGLTWTFPDHLDFEHPAPLVRSDTAAGDRLLARLTEEGMPDALVTAGFADVGEFWTPWCVALQGDEIAAIAFSVGAGPANAETGVYAFPAFRGRGFAAAATAGWASLPALSGRTLFYSTSRSNVSSQRVVQRLGLRFLGASLRVT